MTKLQWESSSSPAKELQSCGNILQCGESHMNSFQISAMKWIFTLSAIAGDKAALNINRLHLQKYQRKWKISICLGFWALWKRGVGLSVDPSSFTKQQDGRTEILWMFYEVAVLENSFLLKRGKLELSSFSLRISSWTWELSPSGKTFTGRGMAFQIRAKLIPS